MNDTCIFCRIVAGDVAATRVLETDRVVAFRDVHPQAPTHVLVVPRDHVPGFADLPGSSPTWTALLSAVQDIVRAEGLADGYRLVINSGVQGGQTVPHLHIHILGGRSLQWPPG